ncbi:MAG: glutamate 5-kinase [Trueperaceae bacterium]|nr:glutamate 5-kinase [Trueperaceae bacterium]
MASSSGNWQRIVIKVGTSSLTDESGRIFPPKMWAIARGAQVLGQRKKAKVVLVSSGAGAAGRERLGLKLPLTLPDKQAAAAVGQTLLMLDWSRALAPLPIAQILLSASDIQDRERYVNAKNALEASLQLGAIPIINENDSVATAEIKVGDNDTLSAWTAYLIGADALIILTDVDGLYDSDPRSNPGAKRIDTVSDITEIEAVAGSAGSSRGTGGMVTKLRAARIATEAGIETLVIGGGGAGLEALAEGDLWGTRFLAKAHTPARKAWLTQQASKGSIAIDAGAFKALKTGRSLLPKGIVEIEKSFDFGDAIAVTFERRLVAQGLSNYGSESLRRIMGKHTGEISKILGYKDYDEVIHRDNLVVLEGKKSS